MTLRVGRRAAVPFEYVRTRSFSTKEGERLSAVLARWRRRGSAKASTELAGDEDLDETESRSVTCGRPWRFVARRALILPLPG
jgi:hypothetical protein